MHRPIECTALIRQVVGDPGETSHNPVLDSVRVADNALRIRQTVGPRMSDVFIEVSSDGPQQDPANVDDALRDPARSAEMMVGMRGE